MNRIAPETRTLILSEPASSEPVATASASAELRPSPNDAMSASMRPDPDMDPTLRPNAVEKEGSVESGSGMFGALRSRNKVSWQWRHKSGYRDYDARTNSKIERAFQRSECKVSIKAGKKGKSPLVLFFIDMIQYDPSSMNKREIRRLGADSCFFKAKRFFVGWLHALEHGRPKRETYEQYEARRKELLDPMSNCVVPLRESRTGDTSLQDRRICERIVSSVLFENGLMCVVLLNAMWIAIEADHNTAATLAEAKIEFRVVENLFCAVFVLELVLRFLAFRKKRDCLKDTWFKFDLFLVFLMVVETWIVPIILYFEDKEGGQSGLSNLSVLRLARLVRLTRVTRLVRWMPELFTLLKGIAAAMRSVLFTMILLTILIYIFGIIFKTFYTMYPGLQKLKYFKTVTESMWSLILHGIFLDEVATVMGDVQKEAGNFVVAVFFLFVFLGTFTILNMLIGFQCEVATRVAKKDRENSEVLFLRTNLLPILDCYDQDGSQHLEKCEFILLLQDPQVHDILGRFGTSVTNLMHLKDIIYEDKHQTLGKQRTSTEANSATGSMVFKIPDDPERQLSFYQARLSFNEFIEVVSRLRGQHQASVTDVVELREYVRQRLEHLERACCWSGPASAADKEPDSNLRSPRSLGFGPPRNARPAAAESQAPAWAADMVQQMARLTEKVERLTSLVEPLVLPAGIAPEGASAGLPISQSSLRLAGEERPSTFDSRAELNLLQQLELHHT